MSQTYEQIRAMGTTERNSKRQQAAELASELLDDIELDRIDDLAVIRKARRLARLLDDTEAVRWLDYELTGFVDDADDAGNLTTDAWDAARRSGRLFANEEAPNGQSARIQLVGQLRSDIESAKVDLQANSTPPSNSEMAYPIERDKAARRVSTQRYISTLTRLVDRVMGNVHRYVAERHQELRFGDTVESAFEVVRSTVDGQIAALVPDAMVMISAAFENAASGNPEHWQNASGTCRRLLKTAADALRPPGPDVAGRKMGDGNYINRLIDWIVQQGASETATTIITSDLEHLGARLDAADAAGHKGAHVGKPVTQLEASRALVSTYLLLGDVLHLRN